MKCLFTKGLLSWFIVSSASQAVASNFHEHLYLWFGVEDIDAVESIFIDPRKNLASPPQYQAAVVANLANIWEAGLYLPKDLPNYVITLFGPKFSKSVFGDLDTMSNEQIIEKLRELERIMTKDLRFFVPSDGLLQNSGVFQVTGFDPIYSKKIRVAELSVNALFRGKASMILNDIFAPDLPTTLLQPEAQLKKYLKGKKVGDLINEIAVHRGVKPREIFESLFEFTSHNNRGRDPYLGIEKIRRNYLEYLNVHEPQQLLQILAYSMMNIKNLREFSTRFPTADPLVKEELKIEGNEDFLNDHTFIDQNYTISIPPTLYGDWLYGLRIVALGSGHMLELLYSLPRYRLLSMSNEQFEATIDTIANGIDNGILDGVDLTASIYEDKAAPALPTEYKKLFERVTRLHLLLDEKSTKHTARTLKIHAFEAANKGPFYDELFAWLHSLNDTANSKLSGLVQIRLGHIGALDEKQAANFPHYSNNHVDLAFDANVSSNETLQGTSLSHLSKIIETLIRLDHPVYLGEDGSGIFGDTSKMGTVIPRLIESGLNPELALQLVIGTLTNWGNSRSALGFRFDYGNYRKEFTKNPNDTLRELFLRSGADNQVGLMLLQLHLKAGFTTPPKIGLDPTCSGLKFIQSIRNPLKVCESTDAAFVWRLKRRCS